MKKLVIKLLGEIMAIIVKLSFRVAGSWPFVFPEGMKHRVIEYDSSTHLIIYKKK